MGWLDDTARRIEDAAKEAAEDVGKIVDRALGFDS